MRGRLHIDPLFVGMTRPAMAIGVPYIAVLANALLTLELFLVTRNLLSLLTALPLHGLAWIVCLNEPRYFELIKVFVSTRRRGRFARRGRWKVVSYAPFSGRRRNKEFVTVPISLEVEK
ncbi:MAG: VirB3 family type IV secretion system protein [Proteobacteria bacterium]|nr:VirB3 family type IV secretion system protein [Pseudomonadota bacterium]